MAWSVVSAVTPPPAPTARVLVATRDLGVGAEIGADDVTWEDRPTAALVADPATSTVVGRAVVSAVRRGEVVRGRDVLDGGLLGGLDGARIATPVRLADASAVALLHAGDAIDVIAASGDAAGSVTAALVATGVRVLTVPVAAAGGGGLFSGGGSATQGDGSLVVLATTPTQALDLARAGLRGRLSFILKPR